MRRIGLALSGGGFRASLYHLGVVRFLKDADLLKDVTDIASVSGGSIFATHLALNWNRYNGTDEEFAEAADEVIRFVRFDVRNHIVRRMPVQFPLRLLQRISLGRTPIVNSNTWMEKYYQDLLYGDTCLYELPERPSLHILATNVSEGGLAAFNRDGLFIQRRRIDSDTTESVPGQMASVAKVVCASSAFPGFFPPVEISAEDLGVRDGLFPTEAFTDGGVFDNLGIRAFSWIRKLHFERNSSIWPTDFVDLSAVCRALNAAEGERAPEITWIIEHLTPVTRQALQSGMSVVSEDLATGLTNELSQIVQRTEMFTAEEFAGCMPNDREAAQMYQRINSGDEEVELGDRVWLNRHLLATAMERASGGPSLKTFERDFDEILVSDAGKPFQILSDTSLGFVAQSVRASDILWDRVWQLERENFGKRKAYLFIPITDTVDLDVDPTALHPMVQAEVQNIRTDLDRFSKLEIRTLIQHGYQVARNICRPLSCYAEVQIPTNPPWNPFATEESLSQDSPDERPDRESLLSSKRRAEQHTRDARALRLSAQRRVWSTLVDLSDWPTYVYAVVLLLLLVVLPYQGYEFYQRSMMQATVIEALSSGDPDFRKILDIVDDDPITDWPQRTMESQPEPSVADNTGMEILTHTRIIDLRNWRPWEEVSGERGSIYMCDLLSVRKNTSYAGNGLMLLTYPFTYNDVEIRCSPKYFEPKIRKIEKPVSLLGEDRTPFEVQVDLSTVPVGQSVEVEIEFLARGRRARVHRSRFMPHFKTDIVSTWLLFPPDMPYRTYSLTQYPIDGQEPPRTVDARYNINHPYGSLIGWSVVNPGLNSVYDCSWVPE